MRILVLGGTAWVGRAVATAAIQAGHDVTCLARGTNAAPPDAVQFVRADRDQPDAYEAVTKQRWDGVIDVARQPGQVRRAVSALGAATDHWAFVSSGNVYRDHSTAGRDESTELLDPLPGDVMPSMEVYGEAKVACEEAVLDGLAERALIARAGLIGGPGDESGRSGYWPWRFAHPSNEAGDVLVPQADFATSLIDVRDLATWLVGFVEGEIPAGIYDAIANRIPLSEFLATARHVAGRSVNLMPATNGWLSDHGVAEWAGPKSLPLWIADSEWQGFAGHRGDKIAATGFAPRALAETLRDVLAWEESRVPTGPHGAGLTDDEERQLLEALRDARS